MMMEFDPERVILPSQEFETELSACAYLMPDFLN
jgi:hypothetical protein